MFCFPCYIFLYKLMLNHFLNFEFYYVVDVEALVPTIDLTLNIFRCDIV